MWVIFSIYSNNQKSFICIFHLLHGPAGEATKLRSVTAYGEQPQLTSIWYADLYRSIKVLNIKVH